MIEHAVAPDGSPVALYLALPGNEDAEIVHAAIPAGAAILELGCGPGRMTRPLLGLGHVVTAVDNSPEMLEHLPDGAVPVLADIGDLDLGARWPVVLFASHGLNDPVGDAYLGVAARHVEASGCIVVQHHARGEVDAIEPKSTTRHGVGISVTNVDHPAPGTVTAVMEYVVAGVTYRQPFTAHEIDIDAMAAGAGLVVDAVLDDAGTWTRLVPA